MKCSFPIFSRSLARHARRFLGGALLCSLPGLLPAVAPAEEPARPDILFILLDDLRYDAMSFLGHPYIETPHIDKLREQGAHFANAFVTTSICCPSRATFLTGTYASRHGVIDNETAEYDPAVTPPLTRYLDAVGYRTAMIGKWHMGHSGHPRPHFDHWLSFDGQGVYHDPVFNIDGEEVEVEGYTTDLLTDHAIEYIEEIPTDEPYFVMLSHKAVHEPFKPAPRHTDAFGADTMDPEPKSWSEDFADKPDWQRRQRSRDVRWDYRTRERETETLPDVIPQEDWPEQQKYVKQLRCAAAVDEGLGRIMEMLKERGTLDRTLIVFASDNGYFHGEHRRWDKRLAYEESLRIPIIMAYPGKIEAGSTISALVTNADFAPTVLSFAGLPVPSIMQGSDLSPLFADPQAPWRDVVFYEYWTELVHAIPTMVAVRDERYKLIAYPEIDDIEELFDLEKDPHEMNNLALDPAHADLRERMQGLLRREQIVRGWSADVFPRNLPRVRGEPGLLLDLSVKDGRIVDRADSGLTVSQRQLEVLEDTLRFDGEKSALRIPFTPETDPAGWPYRIDVTVKPEGDGVIATQSTEGYGYKLFIQDGRPGFAVRCKTWVATTTTIDGPASVLGEWTHLQALIDYNRVTLLINGVEAETIALPLPFKVSPQKPLMIGVPGSHHVAEGIPDDPFKGEIRRFTLQRAGFM